MLLAPIVRWLSRRRAVAGLASLSVAVAAMVIIREGFRRLNRDTMEMNQVVVQPSLFMERELPSGTRVAMEPAGAIRVFTSLYLIDGFGLTTTHLARAGSWDTMIEKEDVEYVFDYPVRLPQLEDRSRFELVKSWESSPSKYVWAPIGLYRRK